MWTPSTAIPSPRPPDDLAHAGEGRRKLAGEALGWLGKRAGVDASVTMDALVMASAARRGDVVHTADVDDLPGMPRRCDAEDPRPVGKVSSSRNPRHLPAHLAPHISTASIPRPDNPGRTRPDPRSHHGVRRIARAFEPRSMRDEDVPHNRDPAVPGSPVPGITPHLPRFRGAAGRPRGTHGTVPTVVEDRSSRRTRRVPRSHKTLLRHYKASLRSYKTSPRPDKNPIRTTP
jgi:hypothetical protein